MYMYPDNLKAKATLWLWELKDIAIIGIDLLISVFALAQIGFILPIVVTVVYAFLSIRFEDTSILDFIRYACAFFILKQQIYEWAERSSLNEYKTETKRYAKAVNKRAYGH